MDDAAEMTTLLPVSTVDEPVPLLNETLHFPTDLDDAKNMIALLWLSFQRDHHTRILFVIYLNLIFLIVFYTILLSCVIRQNVKSARFSKKKFGKKKFYSSTYDMYIRPFGNNNFEETDHSEMHSDDDLDPILIEEDAL
uniref:Uncharacterized protein n=1 Tax=Panagrolaimus sp. JU765 TaxID=591449 RepID=A0AC34PUP3_9BILA